MKKRNPLAVFLLSIVTLGIYDIYWLVKTKKELNNKTKVHVPTIWLLFLPIIILIVVIIILIVSGGSSSSNTAPAVAYGANGQPVFQSTSSGNATTGIVSLIAGFIAFIIILPITFYWFFKFSKAVNQYTSGKMSTGVSFLLLWLLHLLGVAIVQDAFNDMIEAGIEPGGAIAPAGPVFAPQAATATAVADPNLVQPQMPVQAPIQTPEAPVTIGGEQSVTTDVAPNTPEATVPVQSEQPVSPEPAPVPETSNQHDADFIAEDQSPSEPVYSDQHEPLPTIPENFGESTSSPTSIEVTNGDDHPI